MSTKHRGSVTTHPSGAGDWTEVEQSFFDSAPPDEPEPARVDDPAPAGATPRPARTIWLMLATASLLVGLSAAVMASRSVGNGQHGGASDPYRAGARG
jgi:hypothetical protein